MLKYATMNTKSTGFQNVSDVIDYLKSYPYTISYIYIERKEVSPNKEQIWLCDIPLGSSISSKRKKSKIYSRHFNESISKIERELIYPFSNKFSCNIKFFIEVEYTGLIESEVDMQLSYPINRYCRDAISKRYLSREEKQVLDIKYVQSVLQKHKLFLSKIDFIEVQATHHMIDRMTISLSFNMRDLGKLQSIFNANDGRFLNDVRRQQLIEKWLLTFKLLKAYYLNSNDEQTIKLTKNPDSFTLLIDGVKNKKKYRF